MEEIEQIEFSRVVTVVDVVTKGSFDISATKEELEALNERMGFEGIDELTFKGSISEVPNSSDFLLKGTVSSIVHVEYENGEKEQLDLSEDLEVLLLNEMPEDDEEFDSDFEIIENGTVDIGELASQYLSLIVDPWGALESMEALFDMMEGDEEEDGKVNPFKELRERIEEESKKLEK